VYYTLVLHLGCVPSDYARNTMSSCKYFEAYCLQAKAEFLCIIREKYIRVHVTFISDPLPGAPTFLDILVALLMLGVIAYTSNAFAEFISRPNPARNLFSIVRTFEKLHKKLQNSANLRLQEQASIFAHTYRTLFPSSFHTIR